MGLEIRLLGGFAAVLDGEVLEEGAWRLRKARALVKLLALAPERRLHREQAMELLWPDRDAASAANNLHQAVHAARRALGADALALAGGLLSLDPSAALDSDAFEAAAAAARSARDPAAYGAALDAYGGELLPEDRYEPWTQAPREALRELHQALCLELAALEAESGAHAAAIAALQRALRADPLHEPAHRALMRAYDAAGRRQQALAQYEALRAALRAELEADPDPETRALYRELLAAGERAGAARLPVQLTSFVGRTRELRDLDQLLNRARLVTLTGTGGSGKTRLALAAAARRGDAHPDGTWFVELGGLSDPALVAEAAASAVGMRIPAHRDVAGALAAHVGERRALLVLDTCEHVIDACARLAEELLRGCPSLTLLATSREPLRCEGETTWRVPGLALPARDEPPDPARLAACESVALFVERARAAMAGFALDERSAPDVAAIVDRLDGMPLAIELAAARVAVLAPGQIAARIEDSLDMLGAGVRTALTRQQTLRATIAWSHDLLTGEERVLFRRLSVFAGSFTVDAAEAVCAGGPIEPRSVLDLLARLVDKSLVAVEDAASARYRLLDTIRQFGAERLTAAGERAAAEGRHPAWAQARAAARSSGSSSTTTTCAPRCAPGWPRTRRRRWRSRSRCGASGSIATCSARARAGCGRRSRPRRRRPACARVRWSHSRRWTCAAATSA